MTIAATIKPQTGAPIRVQLIDDSAVVRGLTRRWDLAALWLHWRLCPGIQGGQWRDSTRAGVSRLSRVGSEVRILP